MDRTTDLSKEDDAFLFFNTVRLNRNGFTLKQQLIRASQMGNSSYSVSV